MKHLESYCITQYGQPLMLSQIKTPQPKGNEVLLEILGCGVCHSDLHILDGHFSLGMGKKIDLSKSHKLPLTLGHEIVGKNLFAKSQVMLIDDALNEINDDHKISNEDRLNQLQAREESYRWRTD